MRVLVNAVSARLGGGRRHLKPFLAGLARALPEATIDARVPSQLVDGPDLPPNVTTVAADIPPGVNPRRLLWDQVVVPRDARHADVLLSPLNFGSLRSPVPQVLFQRNPVYFDETFLRALPWTTRTFFQAHRRFAVACAKASECVVVPSRGMLALLEPYIGSRPRVEVVPHGFDASKARAAAGNDLVPSALPWRDRSPRLLHVSHPLAHKNLPMLLRVLHALVPDHPDAALAVTFSADDPSEPVREFVQLAAGLGISDRVSYLGTVPEEEVYPLYAAADVFLFPSITESFGFPVLEALAVGTALVASDIPSNREAGGACGRYHPATDLDAAVRGVVEALQAPDDEREARIAQASRFSWEAHCTAVAAIARELVTTRAGLSGRAP